MKPSVAFASLLHFARHLELSSLRYCGIAVISHMLVVPQSCLTRFTHGYAGKPFKRLAGVPGAGSPSFVSLADNS